MTDESNIGVWLWVVLIVDVNVTWVAMDLWLRAHGHEYLTTEFKEGLSSEWFGPLVVGLLCFTVGAFCWHMFTSPGSVR